MICDLGLFNRRLPLTCTLKSSFFISRRNIHSNFISNNASGYNIPNSSWRMCPTRWSYWFPKFSKIPKLKNWITPSSQHRLTYTIDHKTGEYFSLYPSPTGNPADVVLTLHGVNQSRELAAHVSGPGFNPKPFRIYSSPFYRCLQTIQPTVEALKNRSLEVDIDVNRPDYGAHYDVRTENGLGYVLYYRSFCLYMCFDWYWQ